MACPYPRLPPPARPPTPPHHPPVGAIMILIAIAFRAPHRASLYKQMCGLVFLRGHFKAASRQHRICWCLCSRHY